ncbi:MAG: hypothetical protein K2X48_05175 [Chitinophagaceae bacterium]|nr:hypothetical protein [Chitinophagaceae bacterium]
MNTTWHFPIMILFSLLIFFAVIRLVVSKEEFKQKRNAILLLSLIVVVIDMLMGRYGAKFSLPWWIYYPVPMLMTVLLPPVVLKMNKTKTIRYLILSFLSAPFIHFCLSFFLGWKEYMPFWEIPSLQSFL